MTFNTNLKDEISKNVYSSVDACSELSAFVRCNSKITSKQIIITLENASVARKIYKDIKTVFNISANITVRNQNRFRVKQIYILTINENIDYIKKVLNVNEKIILESDEEKIAFLEGAFLAIGNVTNPQTSRYHLEFVVDTNEYANFIKDLLDSFSLNAKIIKRTKNYTVYIKEAEKISDFLRVIKAYNAVMYFEDIRIYRDHKNMTNRLNNCEQANVDKIFMTSSKQIKDIEKLKEYDMIDLLDEKLQELIEYRLKYPESSLQELSDIISLETGIKITKSGLNHRFRKIKEIVSNLDKKENNN